jgi:hypothetical protein
MILVPSFFDVFLGWHSPSLGGKILVDGQGGKTPLDSIHAIFNEKKLS